jgi:hypothetical protein
MVANMDGMNTLDSLSDNYVLDVRNQNNNNSFYGFINWNSKSICKYDTSE